jgi:hypothetical protein
VFAQEPLKIIAPPPPAAERAPALEFLTPGQPAQLTRPRDQDFYPDQVKSRHDPAFVVPFTATVPTGPRTGVRVGLSGWTAPAGRGEGVLRREASGALAFGISVAWDVDIPEEQLGRTQPATVQPATPPAR